MHDSSLDRVALSENLTFYMTTIRAANENIKHRNVAFTYKYPFSYHQSKLFIFSKIKLCNMKDSIKLLSER